MIGTPVSQEFVKLIRNLLNYDPETGVFTWKYTRGRIKSGSVAGNYRHKSGYIYIMIDGRCYAAHRLAWIYTYEHVPLHVDHKDRDKRNNRISNLRACTVEGPNQRNATVRKDNKSGYKGVSWRTYASGRGKWVVQINIDGVQRLVGRYTNVIEAAKKYDEEARKYYGEFALTNF